MAAADQRGSGSGRPSRCGALVRGVVGKEPVVTSTQFASLIPQGTVLGGVEVGDVRSGRSTDPDINGPDGSGGDLPVRPGAGRQRRC